MIPRPGLRLRKEKNPVHPDEAQSARQTRQIGSPAILLEDLGESVSQRGYDTISTPTLRRVLHHSELRQPEVSHSFSCNATGLLGDLSGWAS